MTDKHHNAGAVPRGPGRVSTTSLGLRAGAVTLTAAIVAVLAVAALHILRPERSPVTHRLSEYATGHYGWLMGVAFWSLGIALLGFSVAAVSTRAGRLPRAVAVVAAAAGAGLIVSGLYPTGASATVEVIHSRASAFATLGLAAVAVTWSLRSPVLNDRATRSRMLAAVAAVALVVSPILHDTPWSGLGQRILWALLALWLIDAALRLAGTTTQ